MLKALVRKTLMEIWAPMLTNTKNGKARTKKGLIGYGVLYGFLLLMLMFIFFGLGMQIGSLVSLGLGWFYFLIMTLITVVLGVFGDVFNTQAALYQAKDNEALMALPIPPSKILFARLINVFIMGLMYESLVYIPAVVAYWVNAEGVTAGSFLVGFLTQILSFVSVTLIVVSLTTGLGFLVALLSRRMKNKSFISLLMTLVFIAAYYFVYFRLNTMIQNLMANADIVTGKVQAKYYPLYAFGRAFDGGIVESIVVLIITLLVFYAIYRILCVTYRKIVTAGASNTEKKKEAKLEKQQSLTMALVRRDFKKFTSSAAYMLNAGLGAILLPILAVVGVIKGDMIREVVLMLTEESETVKTMMPVIIAGGIMTISGMCLYTPPSVSLEAKTLWILQSLPVDMYQVLKAKWLIGLLLSFIPGAVAFAALWYVLALDVAIALPILVIVFAYSYFLSLFGLWLGIVKPNLHWTNETVVVKQGMPITVTLFGGWIVSFAFIGLAFLLRKVVGVEEYLTFSGVILLLGGALINKWMRGKGKEIVSHL